jgi:hypothetical protein
MNAEILRDLKRRKNNVSPVSATTPSLSPSRNGNQNCRRETFSAIVSKPELSPSRAPQPDSNRPLAPIFLRDYSQKRKPTSTDIHRQSTEVNSRNSRYPERAKKTINDSCVVSDGAFSDSGHDEFDPRKKKGEARKD